MLVINNGNSNGFCGCDNLRRLTAGFAAITAAFSCHVLVLFLVFFFFVGGGSGRGPPPSLDAGAGALEAPPSSCPPPPPPPRARPDDWLRVTVAVAYRRLGPISSISSSIEVRFSPSFVSY